MFTLFILIFRSLHRANKMEASPQYPAGGDDEHDRSNSDDGVIHVECIRRMRSRQDEKDADEHSELLASHGRASVQPGQTHTLTRSTTYQETGEVDRPGPLSERERTPVRKTSVTGLARRIQGTTMRNTHDVVGQKTRMMIGCR